MSDSPAAGNPASPEAERAWDAWYEPEQDFARAIAVSTHDEMHRAFLAAFEVATKAERRRIRELARKTLAVCTADEGTQCWFEALLGDDDD